MFRRILLSTALTLALATHSYAQCDQGCDSYDGITSGCGCDTASCGGSVGDTGCCGTAGNCGVGQNYFAGGCGNSGGNSCCQRYVRAFGGINFLDDITYGAQNLSFRDGWGAGFAVGCDRGCFRFELEGSYRHNSVDTPVAGAAVINGNIHTTSAMANLLVDLDAICINGATPYVGAGIGLSYGELTTLPPFAASAIDEGFAYQFIGGLSKTVRPGTRGFVEYRYHAAEFEFVNVPFDYVAHNIFCGLEFRR